MAEREIPKSLNKYQSSESTSNTVGGCGWLEFKHELYYPDDKGQTVPAAGAHYRVIGANGSRHEGKLDANGSVSLKGVGHGTIVAEVEPDIELEIKQLQDEVKKALEELVEAEREETRKIKEEYEKSGWWGKRGKDLKAVGSGLWNFVKNIFSALWSILESVGSALNEVNKQVAKYVLDPLNAPETFKEDVKAIKEKYEALRKFADEDLETYFLFMADDETWGIFKQFGEDYLEAQHYSEYIEGGTEAVFGVILTIITAGAGGAAAAGAAGGRLAKVANSLSKPIKKLAGLLKKKKTKKFKKDKSNKKVATTTVLRRKIVPCFCAQNSSGYKKLGSDKQRKKYLSDYQKQLDRQQKGINNMTVDEYLNAREAYKMQGRNPVAGAMQESTRKKARDDIRRSIYNSLRNKNVAARQARDEATRRTSQIMDKLAALHDPDMVSGGWHKPMPTGVGDRAINSSIGSSWNQKDRLGTLDRQMNNALSRTHDVQRGQSKMNIKLEVCRSKRKCP